MDTYLITFLVFVVTVTLHEQNSLFYSSNSENRTFLHLTVSKTVYVLGIIVFDFILF